MEFKTLNDFLIAKGTDSVPVVKDADGNPVSYLNGNLLTDTFTTVNLGDTPNSNNGDPLRLAFAKINNFMEASYHYSNNLEPLLTSATSTYLSNIVSYRSTDAVLPANIKDDNNIKTVLHIVDKSTTDADGNTTILGENIVNIRQDDGTFLEVDKRVWVTP